MLSECFGFAHPKIPLACRSCTAKSQVVRAGVRLALTARSRHVASAVLICAKKRTPFLHALGHARLCRVKTVSRPLWIASNLVCRCQRSVVIRPVPVRSPLPNVSGHIKESKTIRGKCADWRSSDEAVLAGVLVWEMTLKSVRLKLAAGLEFISPNESLAIQTAARSEFELSFCRQTFPGPLRIGFGIFIRDMDYWISFLALQVTCGSVWMPPVRSRNIPPPNVGIVERSLPAGRREEN